VSITSPVPDEQGIVHTAIGQVCFYCHQPLQGDPAQHWAGATGSIYIHAECFAPWFIAMARDNHEIRKPGYYARRSLR
jgi:hypothetical protein